MIQTGKINHLQSLTVAIHGMLRDQAFQLMLAREPERMTKEIDVVLGYLKKASDDVCRLGEAMCQFPPSDQELEFLTALAQKSVNRFYQAFERWKNTCLH
jgi:hypothetical protein